MQIKNNNIKKKYHTHIMLFYLLGINIIYGQTEMIKNDSVFQDKSLLFLDDSIHALIMDSQYFINELGWRFNVDCIDSIWIPTRSDINQVEDHLLLELNQRSETILVVENMKNYFRQYFGIYCKNKKLIFGIFRYNSNMEDIINSLHIYKSYIQIQHGGYITYFNILFEFPSKLYEINFNSFR